MTKQRYLEINNWLWKKSYFLKIIKILNSVITGLTYIFFISYALYLLLTNFKLGMRLCLVCGIPFILVSYFREKHNSPRPYDLYDITPVIEKDSHGKSFPSRHVFSIFIIGTSMIFIFKPIGFLIIFLGFLLALMRVIGGVHFIKDVIVGALIGIVAALIGFMI